jgi:hypothetical protein
MVVLYKEPIAKRNTAMYAFQFFIRGKLIVMQNKT